MIITIIVDRFEGEWAILKTEDDKTINWPKDKLPETAVEGSALLFTISDDKDKSDEKKQLAKDILNEILQNDNNH
jgi:hypothetical protein